MKVGSEKKRQGLFLQSFVIIAGVVGALMVISPFASSLQAAEQTAVIATVAPDYSSGAHSTVAVNPVGGPRKVKNNLIPTATSDITVVAYGSHFYRIEKYFADYIAKFSIDAPDKPVREYFTLDDPSDPTSNPVDMVFVNKNKAYLLRYNSTKAWIVDPSAKKEADFKIGELDLSTYNDGDGCPEMYSAVIVGDKLFIALQRLTQTDWPDPWTTNTSYVAVFDTTTDTEIDTGLGSDGMKGIPMGIRNLHAIQYLPDNGFVYVQGVGRHGVEYSGGIERIDPDTYETKMILDDEDGTPYGNISGMAIVSPNKGYFVGYDGWGDNTLYSFDPSDDDPVGSIVAGLKNKNISGMENGVYMDENNMLWICNQTDQQVEILNTADDTIDESVYTELNPVRVAFVEGVAGKVSKTLDESSSCFIHSLSF